MKFLRLRTEETSHGTSTHFLTHIAYHIVNTSCFIFFPIIFSSTSMKQRIIYIFLSRHVNNFYTIHVVNQNFISFSKRIKSIP